MGDVLDPRSYAFVNAQTAAAQAERDLFRNIEPTPAAPTPLGMVLRALRTDPPTKAITLHQPWAWALLHAGKDIENRVWWKGFTGELAVHAGKEMDLSAITFFVKWGIPWPDKDALVFGAVIGAVTVTGAHNSAACVRTSTWGHLHPEGPYTCSKWAQGGATGDKPMMHWDITNPRPCTPVPCRGFQKLWNLPTGVVLDFTSK